MITTNFYQTSPELIVSESKKIFGIEVCPTCSGQLQKAYQNLKTYYLNNMAKEVKEVAEFKLKDEFKGSTYANGKLSVMLDELTPTQIKKIFTADEIKIYFE